MLQFCRRLSNRPIGVLVMGWWPCCCGCRRCPCCLNSDGPSEWVVEISGLACWTPPVSACCYDLNGFFILSFVNYDPAGYGSCTWQLDLDPAVCGATRMLIIIHNGYVDFVIKNSIGDFLATAGTIYESLTPDCKSFDEESLGILLCYGGLQCDASNSEVKITYQCGD